MLRKPVILRVAEEGEIRLPRECLKGLGLDVGSRGMVQVFQQRMLLVPLLEVPEVQMEIAAFAEEMETGRGAGAAARRHASEIGRAERRGSRWRGGSGGAGRLGVRPPRRSAAGHPEAAGGGRRGRG